MFSPLARSAALIALAATSLAGAAAAQVPEGSAVVGTFHTPAVRSVGNPGLFIVDLQTKAVTRITGLPAQLTTRPSYENGTWSVALRSSDGAILVGAITRGTVNLYVFQLKGSAVVRTRTIPLGVNSMNAAARVTALSDNRVQVTTTPLDSGPIKGGGQAIVDLSVVPAKITRLPGIWNKVPFPWGQIVIDPTGQYEYRLTSSSYYRRSATTELLRTNLRTRQTCRIASWANESLFGLAVDDDGTLYASGATVAPNPNRQHRVHTIRPNPNCQSATVTTNASSQWISGWGLDLDRRTGQFVLVSVTGGGPLGDNSVTLRHPKTGVLTLVTHGPPGGWAVPNIAGIAVNNGIESYGRTSDGNNRYWFDNFPNPGGQPSVGNAKFSLTLRSAPSAPVFSGLVLSAGRARTPILGAEVLVDLRTALVMAVPRLRAVALPIPNSAQFRGAVLTAQSVHFEPSSPRMFASRGLTFTIQ